MSLYFVFDDIHTNLIVATIFTNRASRATIQLEDMKDAKFIGDLRDGLAVQLEDVKGTENMKRMEAIKESS